ncbi:MAG: T9SS type A sorting domain-containing protein [Flavobacteriales bacterium]
MLLSKTRNRWPGASASLLLGCLLFVASPRCEAQNLVPNPSFEQIDSCPGIPPVLGFLPNARPQHWYSASGSPDYFSACEDSVASVPYNVFGYQEAFDGQAYTGMATFLTDEYREMAAVELLSPLITGETYYASFYANATHGGMQPFDIGCSNIGILFTVDPYEGEYNMPDFGLRNYAQVYSANVITDTLGWTLVSGSFVADSAYRYMVIGNHFDNAHTDTTFIGPDPSGNYYGLAYTLVDQICVSPDPEGCPMATGVIELSGLSDGIFPNPVRDELHAFFGEKVIGEITVVDLLGRSVWAGRGDGFDHLVLTVLNWAKGQYILNWIGKGGRRSFRFVIVE